MSARILVVDDVEVNVRLLEAKLSAEYFNVLTANDGIDRAAHSEEEQPDIILLDVMMPRLDGFEVCRRLKADRAHADIPVVMVTALSEPADRVRGPRSRRRRLPHQAGQRYRAFRPRALARAPAPDDGGMAPPRRRLRPLQQPEERGRPSRDRRPGARPHVGRERVRGQPAHRDAGAVRERGDPAERAGRPCAGLRSERRSRDPQHRRQGRCLAHRQQAARQRAKPARADRADRRSRGIAAHRQGARSRRHRLSAAAAGPQRASPARAPRSGASACRTACRRIIGRACRWRSPTASPGCTTAAICRSISTGCWRALSEGGSGPALLLLDIDWFKRVNDTHGHAAGDAVLREVTARVSRHVRAFDLFARYGGEEFVVVLPETPQRVAETVAERSAHRRGGRAHSGRRSAGRGCRHHQHRARRDRGCAGNRDIAAAPRRRGALCRQGGRAQPHRLRQR